MAWQLSTIGGPKCTGACFTPAQSRRRRPSSGSCFDSRMHAPPEESAGGVAASVAGRPWKRFSTTGVSIDFPVHHNTQLQ
jgi:hypothetical protein